MATDRRQPEGPLAEVIPRLVQSLNPARTYLYGSQARDEATYDSDWDILIVVPQSEQPRYAREQEAYRAISTINPGVPIEVVVLTQEEFERELPVVASLPAAVAREGRLLYAA